ncbi:heme peroxidase [Obelidium mucronatum]|nr:heme peroxidase [Obelidium mucronatum]
MANLANTLWWMYPLIHAIVFLDTLRASLFETGVYDTSIGLEFSALSCVGLTTIRTLNGTCNDLANPYAGSQYYRFGRTQALLDVAPEPDIQFGGYPNPRILSQALFTRKEQQTVYAPEQNLWSAAWIQFQIHDWFQHINTDNQDDTINVPIERGDPLWNSNGPNIMKVQRTLNDSSSNVPHPLAFVNNATHWWDLSQLYGTNEDLLQAMRSHKEGKLLMDDKNLIPLSKRGIELTGFAANWWIGLSLMHNLFARNHNRICSELAKEYPAMSDEELFQTARLVNSAISAKIHTVEWTPALLGNEALNLVMNLNWKGLRQFNSPPLVGNANKHPLNVTYQFPEEFVAIYRMHPLLPERIPFQPINSTEPTSGFQLEDTVFGGSGTIRANYSLPDLANSFGTNLMGALTLNNHPTALTNLILPNGQPLDVSMVDILRDRERGIPRYNAYRKILKLPRMKTFSDITSNPALAKQLSKLYNGNVDSVDLLVGSLAEDNRPTGFAFSETTFRLFTVVASRRISADRLFTTDYTPAVYTAKGLSIVEDATMKSILVSNFPELSTVFAKVSNPFLLWHSEHIQSEYDARQSSIQRKIKYLATQF